MCIFQIALRICQEIAVNRVGNIVFVGHDVHITRHNNAENYSTESSSFEIRS